MAFVPSYGYARAVTRGTRNSARAYQRKMVGTAKYKTRPKTGTKRRMKFPVGAAIEVAGAGYRYLRTRRMRKKAVRSKNYTDSRGLNNVILHGWYKNHAENDA